eukprot:s89_g46.t1
MATLRVLGAPGPPILGRRPEERPEKRERYLLSSRSNASDDELWCFIHGEPYDPGRSDHEEVLECEEGEDGSDDGDFSLVTEQIEETSRSSDPAAPVRTCEFFVLCSKGTPEGYLSGTATCSGGSVGGKIS